MARAAANAGARVTARAAAGSHADAQRALVRNAAERGGALRIVGAGTWLNAGAPCSATARLDIASLDRVVQYEPGDLTLTVGAGCTLERIAALTAEHGQWLTLDPFGSAGGTIGATVATGSYGPLASAFGTPRDHVLGCEFITGNGDVINAGGRVVKNVAGFDLVRLVTGSWGTVGAITELTLRLRARPELDQTLAIRIAGRTTAAMAEEAWRWLKQSDYAPSAAELVSPTLAVRVGLAAEPWLLCRFGGNRSFVRAAVDSAASLGAVQEVSTDTWLTLRESDNNAAAVFRASALPSRIAATYSACESLVNRFGGHMSATLGRGVVRCVIPDAGRFGAGDVAHLSSTCTVVAEVLPASCWAAPTMDPVRTRLAHAVLRTFDPREIMNPGILRQ